MVPASRYHLFECTLQMASAPEKFAPAVDLPHYCRQVAERAKQASINLAQVSGATKIAWLCRSAELLRESVAELQKANQKDLKDAPDYG